MNVKQTVHIPVLADALAEQIILPQEAVIVDATLGQGGHSYLFGRFLGTGGTLIGFDVDNKAIPPAQERLKELKCKVILIRANFSEVKDELGKLGINSIDLLLADLGICSQQLVDNEMGLSFQQDMPLDMRMDKRLKRTAADIVNEMNEKNLANLIYDYGEERASRRIARFIREYRKTCKIRTTKELSKIVCRALGKRPWQKIGRIHPATRTFQALRIAVNNELENLQRLLEVAPEILRQGGKVAIISFHSLEDRLVKNDFRTKKDMGIYRLLTKKPIVATAEEVKQNARSRSAKLRIAERL